MWKVVTNGAKYRIRNSVTRKFYTEFKAVAAGIFSFGYDDVVSYSNKEAAITKAAELNLARKLDTWTEIEDN